MSKQPEALRLADALDYGIYDAQMARVMDKAAAELRRLSAVEADFHMAYRMKCDAQTKVLHAQRDALLKALRKHVYLHDKDCVCEDCAAIKAVEENT